jgi:Holliday junction resolvase RusA-like endonuclease
MRFTLNVVPPCTTHQQQRVGRLPNGTPILYKPKKYEDAQATLAALLMPHVPPEPLVGPLHVEVHLYFPKRKSGTKKQREDTTHTARPDLDNWMKGFLDLLATMRFIENDASVVELVATKQRDDQPRVEVALWTKSTL